MLVRARDLAKGEKVSRTVDHHISPLLPRKHLHFQLLNCALITLKVRVALGRSASRYIRIMMGEPFKTAAPACARPQARTASIRAARVAKRGRVRILTSMSLDRSPLHRIRQSRRMYWMILLHLQVKTIEMMFHLLYIGTAAGMKSIVMYLTPVVVLSLLRPVWFVVALGK